MEGLSSVSGRNGVVGQLWALLVRVLGCRLVGGSNESVPFHAFPDPLQVAADFGVDARLSGSITGDVTPGDDALQGTPAD